MFAIFLLIPTSFNIGDFVTGTWNVGDKEPSYGWGTVTCGDCGQVSQVSGSFLRIDYRVQTGWTANVSQTALCPMQVGSKVMVKAGIGEPCEGWGGVSPGDCGTITQLNFEAKSGSNEGYDFMVDFPAQSGWYGCAIEMVPCRSSSHLKANDAASIDISIELKKARLNDSVGTNRQKKNRVSQQTKMNQAVESGGLLNA